MKQYRAIGGKLLVFYGDCNYKIIVEGEVSEAEIKHLAHNFAVTVAWIIPPKRDNSFFWLIPWK